MLNHSISHQRKQLRQQLRKQRRQLSPYQQKVASKKIALRLIRLTQFKQAKRIAFYQAADGEINTQLLIKIALKHHKHCYLPVLQRFPNQELGFVRIYANSRLHKHRFGFKEPKQKPRLFIYQLDIVCMPLVGFDKHCQRLGMGGGFYDRSLAAKKYCHVFKLGLAHDCQQVNNIPTASWDIALDAVVTPTQYYLK
jgi:5-formyltetrahydrofolate cyclo-ligase